MTSLSLVFTVLVATRFSRIVAEGQRRTDTGSPLPVFKPVARLGTEASLDQSLDTSRELVPYSPTAIRQHPGTRSRRWLPTLDLVHEQAVDDTGAIFEELFALVSWLLPQI